MGNIVVKKNRKRLLKGESEKIDSTIPLKEQVDLLPYDPDWEFKRNRIFSSRELKSEGVIKFERAQALGTFSNSNKSKDKSLTKNKETLNQNRARNVLVKGVRSSEISDLKCLVSELKLLIHLGHHLNLVNLLGACTTDIKKGEMLIMKEFCYYGNLQNYLIENKMRFFNECDRNGEIRKTQRKDDFASEPLEGQSNESTMDGYYVVPISYNTSDMVKRASRNLERDGIRTRDLICWSFQIARGMGHLASKNLIHGKLMTRKILLTKGNVVKISDLGSININHHPYSGIEPNSERQDELSFKWMAIESLANEEFSNKSDVWSFGILLWEIFSLGQMPYDGTTNVGELVQFLQDGQRMTTPKFAPNPVGALMDSCWVCEPVERPDFPHLEEELKNMMEISVQHYYLELNNEEYMQLDMESSSVNFTE